MPLFGTSRLVRTSGLLGAAFALAIPSLPARAATDAKPLDIGSFSGAYLAARVAEVDNDLEGAVAFYKRALLFQPDDQGLQQSLMLALISRGSFDEALPYAEKLKTVAEVERFSRLALAVDSIRDKKYGDARNWLKLALESDLDRLIVSLVSAWATFGEGDAAAALAAIDALEGPEWYGVFKSYHRALIAEAAGRKDDALKAYQATQDNAAAGGAAPDTYIRANVGYASFLARGGDREKALAVLARADEFSPNRPQVAALRADIEAGSAVPGRVASVADGASEVLLDLGAALNRGGGEAFVRLYLQYALALKPDSDAVLFQLAQVAEQQQDSEGAIVFYKRIADASPLKRLADLQYGLNLSDLERHEEAIAHLKALVDATPDDMRAYVALGNVYAGEERYREAADLYERAVARLPEPKTADWNVFYQRGIAYERLKDWAKAEPSFRKALELFPNQPQVLNYLGYSMVDMNRNLEEGLSMIRAAVDLRPNDGYIVDSLGWAYYRLGRYDEAVTELERAVSLKPDDAVLNDHLGDAYWRGGRQLEATFQWAHARDMRPEPDLLAQVVQKLINGLPAQPAKSTAEAPAAQAPADPAPAAPAPAVSPALPDTRTDAEPATQQPLAKAVPASYRVQPGQSLWSIADDVLGAGNRYIELLDLNPELKRDPGLLVPGQELRLPVSTTP